MSNQNSPYDLREPFKVVDETTEKLRATFPSYTTAQAFADALCRESGGKVHFQIYEVIWAGGSSSKREVFDRDAAETFRLHRRAKDEGIY